MTRALRVGFPLAFVSLASVAALAPACTNASGHESGGDPTFDASLPSPPPVDASPAPSDAGDASEAGDAAPTVTRFTWTDLYGDFFGAANPPGPGCARCHSQGGDPNAVQIWDCGATKDSCYAGLTNPVSKASLVVPGQPSSSIVLGWLRTANNPTAGQMPRQPSSYIFSDDAIARIRAWIAAGAKND